MLVFFSFFTGLCCSINNHRFFSFNSNAVGDWLNCRKCYYRPAPKHTFLPLVIYLDNRNHWKKISATKVLLLCVTKTKNFSSFRFEIFNRNFTQLSINFNYFSPYRFGSHNFDVVIAIIHGRKKKLKIIKFIFRANTEQKNTSSLYDFRSKRRY